MFSNSVKVTTSTLILKWENSVITDLNCTCCLNSHPTLLDASLVFLLFMTLKLSWMFHLGTLICLLATSHCSQGYLWRYPTENSHYHRAQASLTSVLCQKQQSNTPEPSQLGSSLFCILIPCWTFPGPDQSGMWSRFGLQFQFINSSFLLTGSVLCQRILVLLELFSICRWFNPRTFLLKGIFSHQMT